MRFPAQLRMCLCRIADEAIDLGWSEEARVLHDVLLPVESDVAEGELTEFADRMGLARGDHVIDRCVLLEHHPHCFDVVRRGSTVELRLAVAEPELAGDR